MDKEKALKLINTLFKENVSEPSFLVGNGNSNYISAQGNRESCMIFTSDGLILKTADTLRILGDDFEIEEDLTIQLVKNESIKKN